MTSLITHFKKKSDGVDLEPEPLESYPVEVKDYDIEGAIGKGAFASVYVAKCTPKGTKVAIKVIEFERETDESEKDKEINFEEMQKEAAIMTRMNHPNIVRCLASFTYKTELWLVMPMMEGGSLSDLMKNSDKFKNGVLDEICVATIMKDVISGVQYCHSDGRVHRDIKAANVLLSSKGVAQLSDFGVSGAIIEGGLKRNGRHTFTGSLWWMAPEVLQRENKHSYPADIWSLGITALEISFGKPPHAKQRPVKVMLTILQQDPPTIQSCIAEKDSNVQQIYKNVYNKKFKDFLKQALQKDPSKRPSAKDLLNHSFLKLAKDSNYIKEKLVAFAKAREPKKELPKSLCEIKENNINSPKEENDNIDEKDPLTFDFSTSGKHDKLKNGNNINKNDENNDKEEKKDDKKVGRFIVSTVVTDNEKNNNEKIDEKPKDNKKDESTVEKKGRFLVQNQTKE